MLGRGRREERREERHDGPGGPGPMGGGGANRYQMTQRMFSIGDDFWIENERGEKVYKVDGKALRVRQTLIFEDRAGRELCKIQERMLRVKDSMEVEDADGRQVAMIKKALITPVRERWTINLRGGPDLEIQGNILDHEYRIERVLGQGGFGITYLATDLHLDASVAIKEYLPEDIAYRSTDDSVSAVREKAQLFTALESARSPLHRWRKALDAWCAWVTALIRARWHRG